VLHGVLLVSMSRSLSYRLGTGTLLRMEIERNAESID